MPRLHRLSLRFISGVLGLACLLVVTTCTASAHTCGSNWCSGSDSNTATNQQGNGPQVYIGEVSTYTNDFYGTSGIAWNNTGANSAVSRYNAGTGIGVEDYYFGGGSGANNQNVSAYCWGAMQGYHQEYDMWYYHNSFWTYQHLAFLDIEDPISNYGWFRTQQAANRDVFNGWSDFVAARQPCGLGYVDTSQYGVYSSPSAWNNATGSSSIANTYIWTYETCCTSAWPGASWGGRAQWFGSSSYNWGLQFEQSPDWNDVYEPDYFPVLGITLGN